MPNFYSHEFVSLHGSQALSVYHHGHKTTHGNAHNPSKGLVKCMYVRMPKCLRIHPLSEERKKTVFRCQLRERIYVSELSYNQKRCC